MWGASIAPPRYKEGYVVTMVDKYCAIKEALQPLLEKINFRAKRQRVSA